MPKIRRALVSVSDKRGLVYFAKVLARHGVQVLHPKIHGGLLGRRDVPEHMNAMREHGIAPIDLVVVSLYPFAQTVAKPGVTFEEAIENIDIGGPSMLRSAAKNHESVTVIVDPA